MNAVKEIKHANVINADYFHRLTSEVEIPDLRFDEY